MPLLLERGVRVAQAVDAKGRDGRGARNGGEKGVAGEATSKHSSEITARIAVGMYRGHRHIAGALLPAAVLLLLNY